MNTHHLGASALSTWILLLSSCTISGCATSGKVSDPTAKFTVSVEPTVLQLLLAADHDHDQKITLHDGPVEFRFQDQEKRGHLLRGAYPLSVFLQSLALAHDQGAGELTLSETELAENPVDRTSRLIREIFWDGLTRRTDEQGLIHNLQDSKNTAQKAKNHLYVPLADRAAVHYFEGVQKRHPELRLEIRQTPRKITSAFMDFIGDRHGLLSLKVGTPYVVPGGRFNEMYGWDSYFITRGLLLDQKTELARSMVDNHAYQIRYYGKILNANRSYYLSRSQPPFFTSMLRAVHEKLPRTGENKVWLRDQLRWAIEEYRTVWTVPPRLIRSHNLSRYFDEGHGPGPEVEVGAYDAIVAPFARAAGLSPADYLAKYEKGQVSNKKLEATFKQDRTVRETGHDTTYRFDLRANDFLTVDLNSLLYKYETDIAELIEKEFGGSFEVPGQKQPETTAAWRKLANTRRNEINRRCWNAEKGFYFDYDFVNEKQSNYVSATGLYPLWAGLATPEQARKVVDFATKNLEFSAGLAASTEASRGPVHLPDRPQRQWDFPYGWPPHQIIAWDGLTRYGLIEDAQRLAYRWVSMMARNARDFNGMVTEKYNVVTGSHEAFVEYGNVGSKFSYITKEGFGWTNASFQIGLRLLSSEQLKALTAFKPLNEVFNPALTSVSGKR
ncbi:MAG: trehalase [Methylotenera sp.]|nr:trehalase [Oligoflexia bacterium]